MEPAPSPSVGGCWVAVLAVAMWCRFLGPSFGVTLCCQLFASVSFVAISYPLLEQEEEESLKVFAFSLVTSSGGWKRS